MSDETPPTVGRAESRSTGRLVTALPRTTAVAGEALVANAHEVGVSAARLARCATGGTSVPAAIGRSARVARCAGAADGATTTADLSGGTAGFACASHAIAALATHPGASAGSTTSTTAAALLPHAAANLTALATFNSRAARTRCGADTTTGSTTAAARLTDRAASDTRGGSALAGARTAGAASSSAARLRGRSAVVAHGSCRTAPLQTTLGCSADVAGAALLTHATAADAVVGLIAKQIGPATSAGCTTLLPVAAAIDRRARIDDRISSVGRRHIASGSSCAAVARRSTCGTGRRLTCRAGLRSPAISSAGRNVSTAGHGVVTTRVLTGLTLPATRRRLGHGRAVLRVSAAARETSRNGHPGRALPRAKDLFVAFSSLGPPFQGKLLLPRG